MRLKPILRHPALWGGLLGLLWIVQSVVLVRGGNWGWRSLFKDWRRPLVWRSARFYRGETFAEQVTLLRQAIPPEALVVLPPVSDAPALGQTREMEWFLFPRQVTNCLDQACLEKWAAGKSAFVVWVPGAFEIRSAWMSRWLPLREDLGIVLPKGGAGRTLDVPSTGRRWLLEWGYEIALLFLMFLGGMGIGRVLKLRWESLPDGVILWALGSGLMTLGMYGLLLLGLSFRVSFVLVGGMMLLGGGWGGYGYLREGWPLKNAASFSRWAWRGFVPLLGWLVLLMVLAVGKGYHASDALSIWGVKGYGIAQWGLRQGTYLGLVRDYPLHVPLLIALPKALWGDAVGMSKLIFPLFLLGIMTVLYWSIYAQTQQPLWAFLGGAFWATAPLVVRHAEIAYANLALAFYLFLGLWVWHERNERLAAGLLLAWAVWTRPEGWILVGVALMLGWLGRRLAWEDKSVWLFPVLMTVFWLATRRLAYAYRYAPGVLSTFLPGVKAFLHGEIHLDAGWTIMAAWGRFGWPRLWGAVGGLALVGLMRWAWRGRERLGRRLPLSSKALLAISGGSVMLAVSVIYYFTAYFSNSVQWWINTGFDRLNLPGMLLLWYAVWAEGIVPTHPREVA